MDPLMVQWHSIFVWDFFWRGGEIFGGVFRKTNFRGSRVCHCDICGDDKKKHTRKKSGKTWLMIGNQFVYRRSTNPLEQSPVTLTMPPGVLLGGNGRLGAFIFLGIFRLLLGMEGVTTKTSRRKLRVGTSSSPYCRSSTILYVVV